MKLSDELVKAGLEQLESFTQRAVQWADRGARRSVVERLVTGSSSAKDMEAVFDSFQVAVEAGRHLRIDVERLLGGRSVSVLTAAELSALNAKLTSIHQLLNAIEAAVLLATGRPNSP